MAKRRGLEAASLEQYQPEPPSASHESLVSSISESRIPLPKNPILSCDGNKRPRHSTVIITPDATPLVSLGDDEEGTKACKAHVGLVFEAAPKHLSQRLHKERPSRIACIREALQEADLLGECNVLDSDENSNEDKQTQVIEIVRKIHSRGYLARLQILHRCPCLQDEAAQYDSIYLTRNSWDCALQAVSSLCQLLSSVLSPSSLLKSGFACIRPPGHHSQANLADGYCLINNVAVAAQFALDKFPQHQKRIAIIDWDVHHGNGTQEIFWNNSQVLCCSIHVQQTFPFSPGSTAKCVGGSQGKTVNLAWSSDGMGDREYLAALQHLIIPMVQEFQPTLILISAGFDAAKGDVGNCNVTPQGFGQLTHQVMSSMKNCPVVASLEGGYKHSILGECVSEVVRAMNKNGISNEENDIPDISLDAICPIAAKNIQATRKAHQPYWECLSR